MNAAAWRLTLAASVLMGLAMGGRSAFGLFISPLNTASGMGLPALSLALALGQLAIGVVQPAIGALADRHGAARVIVIGALLLTLTMAVPAIWPLPMAMSLALVASAVAGSTVGGRQRPMRRGAPTPASRWLTPWRSGGSGASRRVSASAAFTWRFSRRTCPA